jgi:putative membrane protein
MVNSYLRDVMVQWGRGSNMMEWGYGMGGFGIILNIIIWVAIIIGIVFLVRWMSGFAKQKDQATKEDSALEILKKRYVSGEISKEEFEQKRKDIL